MSDYKNKYNLKHKDSLKEIVNGYSVKNLKGADIG